MHEMYDWDSLRSDHAVHDFQKYFFSHKAKWRRIESNDGQTSEKF